MSGRLSTMSDRDPAGRARRRAWGVRLTIAGLLLGAAGGIFYYGWTLKPALPPGIGPPSERDFGQVRPDQPLPQQPSGVPLLDALGLGVPGDGQPLDREPAGLAEPPDGRLLARSRRRYADGQQIETSIWSIDDAQVAQTASFYIDAADRADFEQVEATTPRRTAARWLVFVKGDRRLTVRIRSVGPGVRVWVQLVYTGPIDR